MKTFPLAAVAVTLVVAFICVQESDAAPAADIYDILDGRLGIGIFESDEDVAEISLLIPFESARLRGHPHCRYCCACCPSKVGCGICCTF